MMYIYKMDPKGNVTIHINAKDLARNGYKKGAFVDPETMGEATMKLITQMLADNAVVKVDETPDSPVPDVPIRIDSFEDGSIDVVLPKGCNIRARNPFSMDQEPAGQKNGDIQVAGFQQPQSPQNTPISGNPILEMLKQAFLDAMERAADEEDPCEGCSGDCEGCEYDEDYDEEYDYDDADDEQESDIVGADGSLGQQSPKKNPYAADNIYDSRYLEANIACAAVDRNIKETGMASIKLIQPKMENIINICRMVKPYVKKLEISRSTLYKTKTDDGYILLISAPHKTYPMICTLLMEHGYPTDDICWRADKGIFDAYCDEHCELICKDAINRLAKL